MQKLMWFFGGLFIGLTALSITRASVPSTKSRITDDTAIYQRLSEIRVRKEAKIDFDADINRLARLEGRYQEKLPSLSQHPRLKAPLKRVSQEKYRPSQNQRKLSLSRK
jgi:hypothetical protein